MNFNVFRPFALPPFLWEIRPGSYCLDQCSYFEFETARIDNKALNLHNNTSGAAPCVAS